MAMIKSHQRCPGPRPFVAGILISIIGSACVTTEKTTKSPEADSSAIEVHAEPPRNIPDAPEDSRGSVAVSQGSSQPAPGGEALAKFEGYYILEKGETTAFKHPLPNYIPFFQVTMLEDKVLDRYLRYRGWDFNKDGFIDMLEELGPSGKTQSRKFDFNFDGKIDRQK
ncbi:hypothetical protein [Pseudobacteriovorax antillogorgiicola]|uniref:Uncharacterized protein n=1 Tax=Pseudobacteriovorax antillogorgiicola TaxID=1513793 RepID=A0A1Y6CPM5_9BACT|nr:hypothetical protein [Pseudobacteriovorax antillogorgiicola]TCS44378.1 hypothetical protein EDD56_1335 [Pseudobacteriovorax antillogorgiicola]SMF79418.1 hypothetical protein SAMN06296036_13369 [Pseudobacteriovorax antillogorgiicola]